MKNLQRKFSANPMIPKVKPPLLKSDSLPIREKLIRQGTLKGSEFAKHALEEAQKPNANSKKAYTPLHPRRMRGGSNMRKTKKKNKRT